MHLPLLSASPGISRTQRLQNKCLAYPAGSLTPSALLHALALDEYLLIFQSIMCRGRARHPYSYAMSRQLVRMTMLGVTVRSGTIGITQMHMTPLRVLKAMTLADHVPT